MSTQQTPLRLSDVTATDFARLVTEKPVLLLPLGSHEDHGPHLPMGDFVLAGVLADRIAAAARLLGVPAFVAPVMPYGVADFFAASPGAMAVSPEMFRGLLNDLLGGLIAQGLNRIVILNGHGGNVPVIHEVTLAIKKSGGPVIPALYLWKLARAMMQTRIAVERFGHGAEPLASLNAALRPDCVDFAPAAKAEPAHELGLPVCGFGTVNFAGFAVDVPTEFSQMPDDAIRAAAPAASAALGQAVADELAAYGAAFLAHFAGVT
jgi:creatinine amidohydrolase